MFEAMEGFGAAIVATRSSVNLILDEMIKNVLFQNILLKIFFRACAFISTQHTMTNQYRNLEMCNSLIPSGIPLCKETVDIFFSTHTASLMDQ